jgi:ring-1,2-phenylacetyl-CoA epoxidase subunit PaaC
MDMRDHKLQFLLRLGDTALVLGQRLTEWVGKGPAMEEDMALANTALDLIGQARMWFACAGETEGKGRTEDDFAYLRDAHEFRNMLLVEQPNGDYADTLMRQYLFDSWHLPLLTSLTASSDERIAGIAEKASKEVTYHLRRSAGLVVRLGDGTPESHRRMQRALDDLWMYTGELFSADEVDQAMEASGVACATASLHTAWQDQLQQTLAAATLTMPPAGAWMQRGGKQGRHSEHMGFLLAEMQFLQRAYPRQQW